MSRSAKLELQAGFMLVRTSDELTKVVLDELDLLLVESSAVSITVNLIAELTRRKVRIVFCDSARNPIGEVQPYYGCHDVSRRVREQLAWSERAKAEIWQSIVRDKIRHQAALLASRGCAVGCEQLLACEHAVRPDDPSNVEGHAARVYFACLFGPYFTRGNARLEANSALDYGYMVMLSAFNRAIVSRGYLTVLGIFHANIYNAYNLSCDLMEPFRPLVDGKVLEMAEDPEMRFGKDQKHLLVRLLHEDVKIAGASQTVVNAISIYVGSVIDALNRGDVSALKFPCYG